MAARTFPILIVDDEPDTLAMLSSSLRRSGHAVLEAPDGESALAQARAHLPSLVVLDLMLPGMSGLEVCKTLKYDSATTHIPIVMLTAKADEIDRIVGLELGADDYICKPFSPRELELRLRAIIRRGHSQPRVEREYQEIGEISLDRAEHEVKVAGKTAKVTATEFKLLAALMDRSGRVMERDRLIREVWGYNALIESRTVDSHLRRLRENLGAAAYRIETVRGIGYRLNDQP